MTPFRLPALPSDLEALDPVWIGTAARLGRSRAALRTRAELFVSATLDDVLSLSPAYSEDPVTPGTVLAGEVRVRPVADVSEALAARLFPVDAVGVRTSGEILDPLGGLAELEGDTFAIPDEALSVPGGGARAIGLASELGVRIDAEALRRIEAHVDHTLGAPRPMLRDALTQTLVGHRPAASLQLLLRSRYLHFLLPELVGLVDFHKSSRYHHKDVWAHTKQVVKQAIPCPIIRWSALLHDIGKTYTRSYESGGKVHFLRHDEVGAYMFEGVATRLHFAAEDSARIRQLILYHLRPGMYSKNWSDSAVRRFGEETKEFLDDLLHLARADVTSKRPGKRKRILYTIAELRGRVDEVRRLDEARRPVVPKGLGRHIIEELGVAPGPRVGELRKLCEMAVRGGELESDPDVQACIAFLRARVAA